MDTRGMVRQHRAISLASLIWMIAPSALAGCDRVVGEVAREVVASNAEEIEAPPLQPVDEAEARSFGEALVSAARAGDADGIERLIDLDAVLRHALAGLKLAKPMLEQTAAGMAQGARRAGLVHQLAAIGPQGDRIDLLRTHADARGRWATIRLLFATGGFEHYDFLLSKQADSRVVAVDAHFLTAGELMSSGLRRNLIAALDIDKGLLERLGKRENQLRAQMGQILRAQELVAAGNAAAAADIYSALPAEVREEKFVLLAWLRAVAGTTDEGRYRTVLDALLRAHPDDPAATVASIDHFFLAKRYDEALAAIAKVEARTAPDAYFGVMRSNALLEMGKLGEARAAAEQAIAAEPGLIDAHFQLIGVLLRARDHDATATRLLALRDRFDVELDVASAPDYRHFVASDRYARFQQELAAAQAGAPTQAAP